MDVPQIGDGTLHLGGERYDVKGREFFLSGFGF
jgi:hypothetical protein